MNAYGRGRGRGQGALSPEEESSGRLISSRSSIADKIAAFNTLKGVNAERGRRRRTTLAFALAFESIWRAGASHHLIVGPAIVLLDVKGGKWKFELSTLNGQLGLRLRASLRQALSSAKIHLAFRSATWRARKRWTCHGRGQDVEGDAGAVAGVAKWLAVSTRASRRSPGRARTQSSPRSSLF